MCVVKCLAVTQYEIYACLDTYANTNACTCHLKVFIRSTVVESIILNHISICRSIILVTHEMLHLVCSIHSNYRSCCLYVRNQCSALLDAPVISQENESSVVDCKLPDSAVFNHLSSGQLTDKGNTICVHVQYASTYINIWEVFWY